MSNKNLILLIFFINYAFIVNSQSDDARVLTTIKASIFSEMGMGIVSSKTFKNFISIELEANKLESKGFPNILFYSIPPQILSQDTLSNGDIITYKTPACFYLEDTCNLIIGINKYNGKVYKLKGFYQNDFKDLYESQSYWYAWKEIKKINRKTINEYTISFVVEGLDFECLLKSIKKNGDRYCLKTFFYKSGHNLQD